MAKTFRAPAAVAALILIFACGARAQEGGGQPLQELFQTELVYPQEKGEAQLTFSPSFGKGGDLGLFRTPVLFEYGVTDRWQVEVEWQSVWARRETGGGKRARGAGSLRLGTKYSFMRMRGSDFHSAVGVEVELPTGGAGEGPDEDEIEYEPYLILARDFPKLSGAQLFMQVGVGLARHAERPAGGEEEDEPAADTLHLNGGFFVPFRRWRFTGELSRQSTPWERGGEGQQMYLTPGVAWHPSDSWEVGVGLPFGLTARAHKFGAILKLTYEFELRGERGGRKVPAQGKD